MYSINCWKPIVKGSDRRNTRRYLHVLEAAHHTILLLVGYFPDDFIICVTGV
jgi:hypothetical protein